MTRLALLFAPLLIAPLLIAAAPSKVDQDLRALVRPVSDARLRGDVLKLVSFGTRHTLSSQTDPKRGIGAALRWSEAEFLSIGKGCGNCLTIAKPSDTVTGRRVPNPTLVTDVLAIQRGTTDPNRVIVISGHIDSRVTDVLDATKDAPGANDDGSGTALVIEAARVLSKYKFPATIVYAVLMGEEQGLLGGKVLAGYSKAQGWQVEANLNNDIVGNSCGSDGVCDAAHVRVFSEAVRADFTPEYLAALRSLGGENDSPSRNLSRFIDGIADRLNIGLDVRQVWRNDRFGRGGDHSEMLKAGYPAVRFSEAVENYNNQHQDLRTEAGVRFGDTEDKMDFPYLARVARLNIATAAALARAPAPPEVSVEGAVKPDTTVQYTVLDGPSTHAIHRRRTDASAWEIVTPGVAGPARTVTVLDYLDQKTGRRYGRTTYANDLKGVRVDDWVFGASSRSAEGYESPVASAVPGGAWKPLPPPSVK